ncbi:RNA polymerase sigma-70 factor, ECF subfamily [bacterium A37T11]|nr:RNA polymerase sigma-70 factor, ECF subfamily [bacterium A37T11]
MEENLPKDGLLVRQLQEGIDAAFNVLYKNHHQAIYANILRLVKDEAAAKDILQDTFASLWQKRQQLDATQPIAGWLFIVSFNNSISYIRSQLKENKAYDAYLDLLESTDDQALIKEQQLQLIEQAIESLSPQKKKVFQLCKLQGKTYDEAAATLQISKHTVKEYLSDAVAGIKTYIQGQNNQTNLLFISLFVQFWLNH